MFFLELDCTCLVGFVLYLSGSLTFRCSALLFILLFSRSFSVSVEDCLVFCVLNMFGFHDTALLGAFGFYTTKSDFCSLLT